MRFRTPAVLVATLAAFALAVASILHGCANEHYRSLGHSDITFAISPRGDELVFNAVGEGGRDLYRLNLTNRRVTRIAATPGYEVDPSLSPDGYSIVYAAGKPGDRADHIFVRSLDGQRVAQLTAADANDQSPQFSRDGSHIVFTRDTNYQWGGLAANWSGGGALWVMKADGSDQRPMREDVWASAPAFSPDGKTILFSGVFNGTAGFYTVAADGSQPPRPLRGLKGSGPCYSPDGQSIAFSYSARYADDQRVFVARVDGSGMEMVPHPGEDGSSQGGCSSPAFTPDGRRLIFFVESWPDGLTGVPKESLWESDLPGGNPRRIAGYGLFDDPLHWIPEPPKPAK